MKARIAVHAYAAALSLRSVALANARWSSPSALSRSLSERRACACSTRLAAWVCAGTALTARRSRAIATAIGDGRIGRDRVSLVAGLRYSRLSPVSQHLSDPI